MTVIKLKNTYYYNWTLTFYKKYKQDFLEEVFRSKLWRNQALLELDYFLQVPGLFDKVIFPLLMVTGIVEKHELVFVNRNGEDPTSYADIYAPGTVIFLDEKVLAQENENPVLFRYAFPDGIYSEELCIAIKSGLAIYLKNAAMYVWRDSFSALNILYKIYSLNPSLGSFGKLEFFFINFWIDSIPAITEMLSLYYEFNYTSEEYYAFVLYNDYFYYGDIDRSLIEVEKAKNLPVLFKVWDSKKLTTAIIEKLLSIEYAAIMLYDYIPFDYRFKYRIIETDKKEAATKLLSFIFEDVPLNTLRFLYVNLPSTEQFIIEETKKFPPKLDNSYDNFILTTQILDTSTNIMTSISDFNSNDDTDNGSK